MIERKCSAADKYDESREKQNASGEKITTLFEGVKCIPWYRNPTTCLELSITTVTFGSSVWELGSSAKKRPPRVPKMRSLTICRSLIFMGDALKVIFFNAKN